MCAQGDKEDLPWFRSDRLQGAEHRLGLQIIHEAVIGLLHQSAYRL